MRNPYPRLIVTLISLIMFIFPIDTLGLSLPSKISQLFPLFRHGSILNAVFYRDNPGKQLEYKRMFLVGLSIPDNGKSAEEVAEYMYPLMTLVFYWLEKIKRFRLSKEVSVFFH